VVSGDDPVELPSDAQRLVAFLALQPGRVPRAYVAGTLWMDGTQARANGNLRSALWRLRRNADTLIDADHTTLAISPDVTIDVDTMITTAHHVSNPTNRQPGDLPTDPTFFIRDLLPGWYDEWVIVERERLHQLSLHALEDLAHHHTSNHHYAAAIAAALAAIRLDPLRESAHRTAITVHLAEGNHSEALRQFHTYRTLLHDELGITPSPQLRAVFPENLLAALDGSVKVA
jgi:DNA-binding SARP family transcriptional activator